MKWSQLIQSPGSMCSFLQLIDDARQVALAVEHMAHKRLSQTDPGKLKVHGNMVHWQMAEGGWAVEISNAADFGLFSACINCELWIALHERAGGAIAAIPSGLQLDYDFWQP